MFYKKVSYIIVLLIFTLTNSVYSQDTTISSKQLSEIEIDSIFTDSVKKKLEIKYAIYRIYEYNDQAGKHFLVMTENKIICSEGKGWCYDAIKAFCFSYKNKQFTLKWKMTDFILPKKDDVKEEFSIWFWTKYFKLDDYDKDGFIDPIIVYGTSSLNDTEDGRIKILVYHHGKKRAIRHQNGTLDYERTTQIDKLYYKLPLEIQERVKNIMENIPKNNHGIFPHGWQEAMKNKKLTFDEN